MARRIQIKRGLYADMPVLAEGELAYCTDIKKLFVGTAEGINVETSAQGLDEHNIDPEAHDGLLNSQVKITWQELKDLRDSKALVPGRQYRITDYVTTTIQENTRSAGHQFDIIVTADDVDKLNENARAVHSDRGVPVLKGITASIATYFGEVGDVLKRAFSGDNVDGTPEGFIYAWGTDEDIDDEDPVNFVYTQSATPSVGDAAWRDGDYGVVVSRVEESYFANSKLEAWKLKYCLDNDTSRFAWADEVNGKGVIYRMIDEFNNDVPYDFKNIQFIRKITDGEYDPDGVDTWVYTFNIWDETSILDASNFERTKTENYTKNYCSYNIIKPKYKKFTGGGPGDSSVMFDKQYELNNIVLLNRYANFGGGAKGYHIGKSNFFDDNCYSITLGAACNFNKFDKYCFNNILGDSSKYNTFGNNVYNNSFGNYVYNNSFGNEVGNNTFGNEVYSNTFGNNVYSNTFGNGVYNNAFGNDVSGNSFGNYVSGNSFGNYVYNNTFGNEVYSNTFGNEVSSNTFGNNVYSNTFGNGVSNNAFGNEVGNNTFGNEVYSNTFGNSVYSNSFGNYVRSNLFGNYFMYNTVKNYVRYVSTPDTEYPNWFKYVTLENGLAGASAANRLNLEGIQAVVGYDTPIKVARGVGEEIVAVWQNGTTLAGLRKERPTNADWS